MACAAALRFSKNWGSSDVNLPPSDNTPVDQTAADWMARRDRGLTSAEQDAYLQWLSRDPKHLAAIRRLERVWGRLDTLAQWRPSHSVSPNPDLLAPRSSSRRWLWWSALAAAAAIGIALPLLRTPTPIETVATQARLHPAPDRLTLDDGSVVELNQGARVQPAFSEAERRVHLTAGEAHFAVAKNPARPFVVMAHGIDVRAVGTAFAVQTQHDAVSVLVTEGTVEVTSEIASLSPTLLVAGQKAEIQPSTGALIRSELKPLEMERALGWKFIRLEFVDLPLSDVVAELNRYNTRKLAVADAQTGALRVAGTFRADNVDAFVRLLDVGFDIAASDQGDTILLQRRN